MIHNEFLKPNAAVPPKPKAAADPFGETQLLGAPAGDEFGSTIMLPDNDFKAPMAPPPFGKPGAKKQVDVNAPT